MKDSNPLLCDGSTDTLENVRAVLKFMSWAEEDRNDDYPDDEQLRRGRGLVIDACHNALEVLQDRLDAEAQSKVRRAA